MDPGDTSQIIIIIKKIETLEPENASKIIEYFLLQEMKQTDLLRYAFGPDSLIQEFCRKAKSELSDWGHLLSKGFSSNPSARPFNTNDQSLSQSCGRNQFLDLSRNSNTSLSPSLIRDNPNSNSSLIHDGSSQFPFITNKNPFDNLQTRSFSANDARLESEQQRMIEEIAQPQQQRMIAAHGSPMSNIQGSRQFGVEEGGFSPGSQERKDLDSKQLFFTFKPKSSFTDEDVSTYFSKFGSVVDVTIPYQKLRTFGFVTFANAETVRTLLARDNLHFICGSRVRVKPYKEKENILQKQGSGKFGAEGANVSPNENIAQPQQQRMIAARGSPMSNRQGSGQFGVEEGGFSLGSQERKDLDSKQLFFTIRPKSSFTDEDVSTYFSKFGLVEGVRIPNQKERRFGFVVFANAETVRTLLARDNLHFICGSRVRVKPYKEKENILQNPGSDEREDINSRKIYLTFVPYSSFTDEDVSTYFSKFGPVVDVYIPYQDQQRRLFGFVTFANAETVKTILDQRNPHYICKSPVQVKPYIEKAKILQNN